MDLHAPRSGRPPNPSLQPEKGGFAQRSFFYVEGNAYRSDASHGERPEAMRIGDVDERRISYPWPADTLLSHLQNGIVAYEERTASTSSADLVGTQLSKAAAKAAAEAQASDAPPAGPSAPAQTLEAVVINAAFAVKSADEVSVELAAEEAADGDVARALERYLRTLELHRGAVARSCISAFTTGLDEAGDIGLDAVRFGVSLSLEDAGGRGGFGTVARHLRGVAVDEREAFLEFVLCAGDARPTLTVLTVLVACPKLELPDPRRPGPDYEAEVLAALRRAAAGAAPGRR
eukprot:tig00001067_g6771.t1